MLTKNISRNKKVCILNQKTCVLGGLDASKTRRTSLTQNEAHQAHKKRGGPCAGKTREILSTQNEVGSAHRKWEGAPHTKDGQQNKDIYIYIYIKKLESK